MAGAAPRPAFRAPDRSPARAAQPGGLLDATEAVSLDREWRALAAGAAGDSLFFHPDLLLPAMRHLGPAARVAAARDAAGRLLALAPVTSARLGRIAPAATVWVHDYGPLGQPLLDRHRLPEAADALLAACASAAGPAGAVVVPMLPVGGAVAAALIGAAGRAGRAIRWLDLHARAALDRDTDGADPRPALPQRRRKEYARLLRRLGDCGPVAVEAAAAPAEVAPRLDEFLALEAAGWKGRAGTALADRAETAAFARAIVRNRAEAGACRVISIRVADRPAAMLVCFLEGATATTWKIAYDESLGRYSPGALLMLEAARILLAEPAIRRIDSLAAPSHPMVDHLWRGRLRLGTLVVAPARSSLPFRAGLAAHAIEQRARTAFRALRRRLRPRRPTGDPP